MIRAHNLNTLSKGWRQLYRSMAAQMMAVILLALITAQGVTLLILNNAHRENFYASALGQIITHTAQLTQQLVDSPSHMHTAMLDAASTTFAQYSISLRPLLSRSVDYTNHNFTATSLERSLGAAFHGRVRVNIFAKDAPDPARAPRNTNYCSIAERCDPEPLNQSKLEQTEFITISIQLPDRTWLNLEATAPALERLAVKSSLLFLGIASLLMLLAIMFIVRRITQPLRALSIASNRLGRGEDVGPLPIQGPDDLRRATLAFNRMNERLKRFVDDRTNMLAAISHDLRTPITTLRLRLELLPDAPEKNQLVRTLDEMQQIVEATLSFARKNATHERSRKLDIDALLGSICEDLMDIGHHVTYSEGPHVVSNCRPVSLRRALRNLIENGVKYGGHAYVSFTHDRDNIFILIEDDGPGISVTDQERVFEPFVRLENSRSRDTGGIGLGMAIARNIIHAHGGSITLENRPTKGLRITVTLPV